MGLRLHAGEYVIVAARPQTRCLVWPVIVGLTLTGAAAYWLGWAGRSAHPSEFVQWLPVLVPAVLVILVLIFLRWVLYPLLAWSSTRFVLTNRRLIFRRGILSRREHDLPLPVIYQLDSSQSLADRVFGGGTLTVDLGRNRSVQYRDVPHIHAFKEYVVGAVEELPMTVMFDGVDMDVELGRETEWIDDDRR